MQAGLTARQSEVFLTRYCDGMSDVHAAARLGLTVIGLRVHLSRAKKKIRAEIARRSEDLWMHEFIQEKLAEERKDDERGWR